MVGMTMAVDSRERLAGLINSTKIAADIPSKLARLHQLKHGLLPEDPVLLSELLPRILELQSDRFSPIRKSVTEMIGEIGLKHIDLLPQIVPLLITVLTDDTPAVVRQSITCAIDLFRISLVKIAMKGLYSSEIDNSLQSLWTWMLKFKEEIYSIAVHGNGGMSLLALKFVLEVILLYTPDPNGSSEPPASEENSLDFNISWLRGGHPILNIRDLSTEASQSLGLLLDQLRFPKVKSLNNTKIIVLINSLSTIARRRPAFYGRILPVLLGLDRSGTIFNGLHAPGVHYALKNAFLTCLKCTHPGALPWRDPLVGALREMKVGELAEPSLHQLLTVNGSVKEEQGDDHFMKDEKTTAKRTSDIMQNNLGRKRSGEPDSCDLKEDGNGSGKRARPTTKVSEPEESFKEMERSTDVSKHNASSSGTSSIGDVDSGPAQQLVAMFGALVAQGEKAIGSLQILISSISADLLAEVVIANMRFLPPHQPDAGDGELLQNMSIMGSDAEVKYPSSFVADVLSLSSTFPPIASLLDSSRSFSDHTKPQEEGDHHAVPIVGSAGTNHDSENAITATSLPASKASISEVEEVCSIIPSSIHDMGNLESGIPGLDSSVQSDGLSETVVTPSIASSGFEDSNQENISTLDLSSSLKLSVSRERLEELSPKAVVSDVNSVVSSTATSAGISFQLVLPKMSAPVVDLVDEEKDELQRLAFVRIVEAYKQIAVAGGLQARSSLLAYLGVEYPLELEPWKVLQNHILADYINNEGHELTLRVLYRLFGEAEEEHDFFSSTTAASVYETFLLTVAETLKDSFPPSEKSLSRLLGEAPYLPKSVINLLECMCSPGNSENADKDLQSGDRVTQGLSAVWSLILLRPPIRDVCLKIALQSTVHLSEEVRMKAIRLVANKLYPIPSISQRIEDFSKEMLFSAISDLATDMTDADGSVSESHKDADPEKAVIESSAINKDISSDTHPSSISQPDSSLPISEAQRRMSLYFALCTKKHSLFLQIFIMYKNASKAIKQAVHDHIPILVRTMGSSSDLLEIITDPPSGSENLVMQVLHILTDGIIPSPELVFTISKLYNSKLKDVEIMILVLPYLPKDEVMMIFPQIVNLPGDKFQAALLRILQGSSHSGPVLNPAEVLIAIHGIDPERDGIPLRKVTDACNACFEQRQTFTQQVVAKVLNQLVEQIPLPLLFMRTVLQAIGAFPSLVDFIMETLSRLVGKQIWKYPKLWVGFLKCALLTKPQSFNVLLQLPPAQLENALNKTAALKAPLVAHASQPNIRSTLPRAVLTVLGITSDTQNTSQVQSSQVNTVNSGNSEKEVALTEKSKESSIAG
ncbi:uncharacterized protein LOC111019424 [Momordica charantia]|uniref:Uncharacterized protein LOC111019424 n=1 Tax=Momordica charantia TaxID=3673 RepID=A0A6J1DBC6_MOMCH|nr:uncharacterized protein LOC111019424 [Momordica charantia]